jgi:hypothetical protein
MLKAFARIGVLCAALSSAPALADTVVWKDPVFGFTMSYPDSWTLQTDDTPNTRLRVAGPLGQDRATCSMKVVADGRVQIYPKEQVDEAVVRDLNEDYWRTEAGQHDNAKITAFYAPAGLGAKGDATAVRVTFTESDGAKKVPMYGIMISSLYGDKRYVAACASKSEVYERWAPVFSSILDSVDFDSRYHPFPNGYYRDFLADPKLVLPRLKPGTTNDTDDGFFGTMFMDKYHR